MGLLDGKLAVVTGAGSGIGAAIAQRFAEEGAQVAVVDINGDAANSVAEAIKSTGAKAWSATLDVSDRDAVNAFARDVTGRHPKVDVLVNNAGIAPRAKIDDEHFVSTWDKVISVNLNGQFDMTNAFIPAIKAARGNIIYTASIAALIAPRSSAGYGAAKAGIVSLTKYMARELGPFGVRVNSIAPGVIVTPMTDISRNKPGAQKHMDRVPLERNGEASEIAGPAVFLASDLASYVTGVTIAVDGGFMAV